MFKALTAAATRVGIWLATLVDHTIGWYRLPAPLGLVVLVGLRSRMRLENLVHTSLGLPRVGADPPLPACQRTADGTFNDLRYPAMGSVGTPLGRNVPLQAVRPETSGTDRRSTSRPSPRTVSNELLARKDFTAAGQLNMLAAAWIQFMVHDWFSHGPTPAPNASDEIEIALDKNDPWLAQHGSMRIPVTPPDQTRPPCASAVGPTFLNHVTHWWDASQLYGSDQETLRRVRTGPATGGCPVMHGQIKMDDADPRRLPLDPKKQDNPHDRAELTGFNENWWIGLSLLHTIFALEHNVICQRLHDAHPSWSDEEIFAHARLINAALIAKIHTVEWTPAILDHPAVLHGMRGEWWGLAKEGGIYAVLAALAGPEVRDGIRRSPTNHRGAPYAMTEEFVAVYRMHTLLPDTLEFRSVLDKDHCTPLDLSAVIFAGARDVLEKHFSMADVAYSFGLQSAGAITLHNYPRALRELRLPNGQILDMAAVDIFRDRERGVPRYNEFRQLVGRPRVSSFGQLVGRDGRRQGWDEEIRRVYGDVDSVDLTVGLFAEPKPAGFGFSDTAFRIFLLMAGRRLQSDRFFTTDFTEEIYTREGLEWIERRTMADVIVDHLPEAAPFVRATRNAFHRWDGPTNQT
jgi:hypothetical protein